MNDDAELLRRYAENRSEGDFTELVRRHREGGVSFARASSFNLDEYVGLQPTHPMSYHRFMHENLFNGLNIPAKNIRLPDGMAKDVPKSCAAYERAIERAGFGFIHDLNTEFMDGVGAVPLNATPKPPVSSAWAWAM